MQKMSYRPGAGVQQTIMKTKADSDTERLVLIKQTQPKHPDMFIKQRWVWEDNAWRLDDEEKKFVASANADSGAEAAQNPTPANPRAIPPGLPGFSDLSH